LILLARAATDQNTVEQREEPAKTESLGAPASPGQTPMALFTVSSKIKEILNFFNHDRPSSL
jgi:hypothetical protein